MKSPQAHFVVVQLPTHVQLCDSMGCTTPGFSVPLHLLEFAQVHLYWIGDAIQPSHPLSSSSPPALNLSQHRGLFQWVSSSHQVAKILELQLQWDLGLISFKIDWLDLLAVEGTPKSLLQHTVRKNQFFGAQSSLWSNSHIRTRLLERPYPWLYKLLSAKWYLCLLCTIF